MKEFKLVLAAVVLSVLCGCATNIAKLPITARDQQTYDNKYADQYKHENRKAVRIAIVPQNPAIQGQNDRTLTTLKSLTATFGDGLETAFSNLADFEVVPRSEVAAIVADKTLLSMTSDENHDYKIKNVAFMVVYNVSSYNFQKFKVPVDQNRSEDRYSAYVKVKVSLINLKENVKEFTKTITGESKYNSTTESIALLNSAVESAIRDFSTQFAIEYAPPAIVQQTKGSGQVALLNIGKDYGLMKKMKVEFFMFKEKSGKRRAIPFAYGRIIEIGEDSCWVEIDDYEKAGVKENHFARVRNDQSRSFLEALSGK
jgi:curli biogenesis system outer membrane secretion channel CsgG